MLLALRAFIADVVRPLVACSRGTFDYTANGFFMVFRCDRALQATNREWARCPRLHFDSAMKEHDTNPFYELESVAINGKWPSIRERMSVEWI